MRICSYRTMMAARIAVCLIVGLLSTACSRDTPLARDDNQKGDADQQDREEPVKSLVSYVPEDAEFVLASRPRRLLAAKEWSDSSIEDLLEKLQLRMDPGGLGPRLLWLQAIDKQLSDIEFAIYVAGELHLEKPHLTDAYLLRFASIVHPRLVRGGMFQTTEFQYREHAIWGSRNDDAALAASPIDSRTLLVGRQSLVKKMIDSQGSGPNSLSRQLSQFDASADLSAFVRFRSLVDTIPPPFQGLFRRVDAARISLWLRNQVRDKVPHDQVRLVAKLTFNDDDSFNVDSLKGGLSSFREMLRFEIGRFEDGLQKSTWQLVADALEAVRITGGDSTATLQIEDRFGARLQLAAILNSAHASLNADEELTNRWQRVAAVPEQQPARTIRALIPSAAGIAYAELADLANSERAPDSEQLAGAGVSSAVLLDRIVLPPDALRQLYGSRLEELEVGGDRTPNPTQIARAMSRTRWLGYATMIAPEFITDINCEVAEDGPRATGTVSFACNAYRGSVGYVAVKDSAGWRIREFSMPARGWKFTLQEDGTWKATGRYRDPFGQSSQALHAVRGTILLDGKPLADARISFYHSDDPAIDLIGARSDPAGAYRHELPEGKYYVSVGRKAPEKYRLPHTSGLSIEVREGENVIDFRLAR